MSHHLPHFHILIPLLFSLLPQLPALPNPDPSSIQQQQTFLPTPSPPATIPSFPEQSAVAACPTTLPDGIFSAVKTFCAGDGHLRRGQCCPVLAAWLYSAYSNTALGRGSSSSSSRSSTTSYDLPMLPDDSETCVDGLEKAMKDRGVNLVRPNSSCDVVYCYCGIRLHQLSCNQVFHVLEDGRLVGDDRVKKLERDCLYKNGSRNHHSTLAHCSKCLNSLYTLKKGNKGKGNPTKLESRTSQMRNRDCELMGLTWLLKKDRDAYISTVTSVMRALMLNTEGSDPRSCSLNSNGLPLAVDFAEFDGQSSSVSLQFPVHLYFVSIFLLIMSSIVLPLFF